MEIDDTVMWRAGPVIAVCFAFELLALALMR